MLRYLGFVCLAPMILKRTCAFAVRLGVRPRRNFTSRSQLRPALHCRRTLDFLVRQRPTLARRHASASFTRGGYDYDHESDAGDSQSVKLVKEVAKNLQMIRNEAIVSQFPRLPMDEAALDDLPTLYLLGVSGGSDSVALLHLLLRCIRSCEGGAMRSSTSLHVVHFDHQQRGWDSSHDSEFVRRLCQEHGLPFHIYSWNEASADGELSQQSQLRSRPRAFSQHAAREWRRSTMRQLLKDLLLDRPASEALDGSSQAKSSQPTVGILFTAHHLDDSNESMLLKLLRGVHVTNLQGMTMAHVETTDDINGSQTENKYPSSVTWGRPLLSVRKAQLVEFLESNGLPWREDVSNQSSKYLRNRVRNELIPLLTDLVGQGEGGEGGVAILQNRLDRLSQQSREVQVYLDAQSDAYLQRQQHLQLCDAESDSSVFYLSPWLQDQRQGSHGGVVLDLAARHAIHRWLMQRQSHLSNHRTQSDFSSSCISYDHMQQIFQLLQEHSQNRIWKLDIGGGWTVVRQGEALLLEDSQSRAGSVERKGLPTIEIEWESVGDQVDSKTPHDYETTNDLGPISLHVPSHIVETKSFRLYSGTVATTLPTAMSFWPPWRDYPMAMKDFLRGQKVPLHQRPRTPLVLLQRSQEGVRANEVVAIRVASKSGWVVSAPFAKATPGTMPIRVLVEGWHRNTCDS